MCVLPPVPALWGPTWREEWERRLATNEPWGLTWLRETTHGDYWQGGSVRIGGTTSGYERIEVPTMIVAGWADGYRNNSFRTMAALAANGVPHRLLAGPWAHADPKTAMPGPRIDLDVEMAAWFDRWLRSDDGAPRVRLRRLRPHLDRARAGPRPPRGLLGVAAVRAAHGRRGRASRAAATTAGRARHRHGSVDRLRRPSPVGPVRRPAVRRRPVAHLGRTPAVRPGRRASPGAAADQRRPAARLAVGQAVRRLPGRHLGPGVTRIGRPDLPRRRARRSLAPGPRAGVRRDARPRRLCLRVGRGPGAAGQHHRLRLAEHDRAARPRRPHRSRGHG